MKICTTCNIEKLELDFYNHSRYKNGIKSECKKCHSLRMKIQYKENRNKKLKSSRKNYKKNKQKIKNNSKNWRKENPEKANLSVYKNKLKKYGLTIQKYNEFVKLQDEKCAICKCSSMELSKRLAVDHDHKTGKIRGLLCRQCNLGLGLFKDNICFLIEAIEYLRRFNLMPSQYYYKHPHDLHKSLPKEIGKNLTFIPEGTTKKEPKDAHLIPMGSANKEVNRNSEQTNTDQNQHPIQTVLMGRNEGILPKDVSDEDSFGIASVP